MGRGGGVQGFWVWGEVSSSQQQSERENGGRD
jgi:hypothetical protein